MPKLSGTVFLDQNGDGVMGATDAGLSGVTINLLNASGAIIGTTTTLADGSYSLNAVAGSYTLKVVAPAGDLFSGAGGSLPVTLGTTDKAGLNAGVYAPVSFSGTVFADNNDNGLMDGADKGVAGVTVNLLDGNGLATGLTTTTGTDGTYSFSNLAPGTYAAQVQAPAGNVFSPPGGNTPPQPIGGAITPQANLLSNGSFEQYSIAGSVSFAGWTASAKTAATPYGSGPGLGVEVATTDGKTAYATPNGTYVNGFASTPNPDNANPYYLGGSGTHALFFVDDGAIESLSQTVSLTAGQVYEVGFDAMQTTPGSNNQGYFQLSAALNGQVVTTGGSTSGTILKPGVWTHFAALYTPATSGPVTLTFTYQSGVPGSLLTSKDVLVDDVYIVPGQQTQNLTPVSQVNTQGVTPTVTLTSGQSVGNESAGLYVPSATIGGTVFIDSNGDGAEQAAEAGSAGRTVNLLSGGVVIDTAVTDSTGHYSFLNHAGGTYTVQVVAPAGMAFSPAGGISGLPNSTVGSNGSQAFTVANGATATINAGLYTPVVVSGTVFADGNADGTKQAAESGISGQTVQLLSGGTVVASTTTTASGAYTLPGVLPGSYVVKVVAPAGTHFAAGSNDTGTDGTLAVSLPTSGKTATVNAAEYLPVSVGGKVYTDANADGTQQAGENGLAGQTVTLTGNGTTLTATTGSDGSYAFGNLNPGSYSVQVTPAAGGHFAPVGGTSTVNAGGAAATGTLGSGQSATVNAGEFLFGQVNGKVYADGNADGTQQGGEGGLSGQTVTLAGNGTTLTATTGTDGSYSFANLAPGSYTVQVTPAANARFSPVGSTSTVGNTGAAALTIASGDSKVVNAGEYLPGTIAGKVYADGNADGTQQATEAGLAAQTVTLTGAGVSLSTGTAADGSYSFGNLNPGSYTVQVTPAANAHFSPVGGTSTVNGSGSGSVVLASGGAQSVNAGEFLYGQVSGKVYADGNADGTQQGDEGGLSGQTVTLAGSGTTLTTTTGADGSYSFANLTPGSYTVQVVPGANAHFSPVGGTSTVNGSGSSTFTLGSGAGKVVNAGEYLPAGIGGKVYLDSNADGTQQAGENGLSGQTVTLTGNGTTLTTTTGSDGSYAFGNLNPGSYSVQVTPAAGNSFAPKGATSGVDGSGKAAVVLASGQGAAVNAGEYAGGAVSGLVFFDGMANGTWHVGDAGVSGVTVQLWTAAGVNTGLSAVTDSHGLYTFSGVIPGSYTLHVLAPQGTAFSAVEHASGNPALDSDVNAAGISDAFTLTSGGSMTQGNAGLVFTGFFPGTTPTQLKAGQTYDGNQGHGVITGAGNDLLHLGSGGNNIAVLGGTNNLVEAGGGHVMDIVTSAGALNAQTQNASSGFLFAGNGGGTLQGGQGDTYLMGGTGHSMLAGGSGINVLAGGIGGGQVTTSNGKVSDYSVGDELRLNGRFTTVLYQKGDGVLLLDGNFDPAHAQLQVYGYDHATQVTVRGQTALWFGGNDLVVFNGAAPPSSNGSLSGVSLNANILAPANESLSFGADGLPHFTTLVAPTPVSTSAVSAPAPTPAQAPAIPSGPVAMSGWNQSLTLGDGNYTVSGSLGNATIHVGNGNSTIAAGGYGNVVTTGSGTNSITAGDGNATVDCGAGNDTVQLAGYGNKVLGGLGHDVVTGGAANTYVVNGVGKAGGMEVFGFGLYNGDVLDLAQELTLLGWNHANGTLGNFLQVGTHGSDLVVGLDATGHGASFDTVAVLHGLGGNTLADLLGHNSLHLL